MHSGPRPVCAEGPTEGQAYKSTTQKAQPLDPQPDRDLDRRVWQDPDRRIGSEVRQGDEWAGDQIQAGHGTAQLDCDGRASPTRAIEAHAQHINRALRDWRPYMGRKDDPFINRDSRLY